VGGNATGPEADIDHATHRGFGVRGPRRKDGAGRKGDECERRQPAAGHDHGLHYCRPGRRNKPQTPAIGVYRRLHHIRPDALDVTPTA
jgi:hypothetical protein